MAPFSLKAEVAGMRDPEVDGEIIPGALFANRASPVRQSEPEHNQDENDDYGI